MKRSKLERELDQANEARKQACQAWRTFVEEYCGFEDGMPTRPDSLPQAQAKELRHSMKYWNKQWAFLCVQLENQQQTYRRTQ